ncbi:MAG: glycosyltransferase family 4 protein [candidate division KSB1 bacterium]|nr:glycosyltransferase family 4 protein [candidate division KSB1 bacterium]
MTQNRVERTIVLGNSLKRIFSRWHKETEIDVVPNGIDLNIDIKHKNFNSHLPTLYFFGNLLKFKGIHIAVQALGLIKKKYPDIQLKIAGNWAYDPVFNESQYKIKSEIEQIIKSEQLHDNIQFLGPVYDERKIELLCNSDILVYPSINDGLPLVILESMAAGNVVISIRDVGAISDVVLHNETGILINQQEPQEVANAIEYLIENPGERKRLGLNAHNRYRQCYTKAIHINRMIEVFNKVLAEN